MVMPLPFKSFFNKDPKLLNEATICGWCKRYLSLDYAGGLPTILTAIKCGRPSKTDETFQSWVCDYIQLMTQMVVL